MADNTNSYDDLLAACKSSLCLRSLENAILSGKYDVAEVNQLRAEAREIETAMRTAIALAEGERVRIVR